MSGGTLNLLIGLAMGLNLLALGSNRLPSLIRAMSVQGMLLGLMPLLLEAENLDWRVILVVLATLAGKGLVIPGLLRRAMRAANIEREIQPFLGYVPSLLLGAGGTIAAVALARALPLLPEHAGSLLVPGAIASVYRFHFDDWPGQGHLAGLWLSDSGKRHLPLRPFTHPLDAIAGGVGHFAGCHRGCVHHRHHRGSYPARL
jgi:hypothetical protein